MRDDRLGSAPSALLMAALRVEVINAFPRVRVDAVLERPRGLPFWIVVHLRHGGYSVAPWAAPSQRIRLEEGDVAIIPPDVPHRIVHQRVLADALHVRFTAAGGLDPLGRPRSISHVRGRAAAALRRLIAQIAGDPGGPPDSFRDGLRRHRAGLDLLAAVAEHVDGIGAGGGGEEQRAKRLERLAPVLERLATRDVERHVGLAEIATWLGLSTTATATAFRVALGVGPATYARRARMARACDLLAGTPLKIRDISARLGFSDEFAFSRQFKRDLGAAPADFRRSARMGATATGGDQD